MNKAKRGDLAVIEVTSTYHMINPCQTRTRTHYELVKVTAITRDGVAKAFSAYADGRHPMLLKNIFGAGQVWLVSQGTVDVGQCLTDWSLQSWADRQCDIEGVRTFVRHYCVEQAA